MNAVTTEFIDFLIKNAKEARENARYSGAFDDGGFKDRMNEIEIYKAGLEGIVPEAWKTQMKIFTRNNDPDYQRYLELKKKFED